jgi:hypothetical protein
MMDATDLYAAMVIFAQSHGARREEQGSGWWWCDKLESECGIGEAVELLLKSEHNIDVREAVPDEVTEFWG